MPGNCFEQPYTLGGEKMAKIFIGQSALRIILKTFIDLEEIIGAVIKYRKPDGVLGSFPAGVADIEKGIIFHECLEGEIDMAGWWAFWAYITFGDGRTAAGETAKIFVYDAGGG
jgi:hypothetical protein